jgi:hypothetical protein
VSVDLSLARQILDWVEEQNRKRPDAAILERLSRQISPGGPILGREGLLEKLSFEPTKILYGLAYALEGCVSPKSVQPVLDLLSAADVDINIIYLDGRWIAVHREHGMGLELLSSDPNFEATNLIEKAQAMSYGVVPNPSEGFFNALRAVEAALKPVIEPRNPTATLGTMIGQLRATPDRWTMVLTPKQGHSSTKFREMLELIWYSEHDRHGGSGAEVTVNEARAATLIAECVCLLTAQGLFCRREDDPVA